MASILSLPDECLHIIVSCIDDPSSFYNIALTCNRFLQATRNTRRVLHTNLLKAKAEYFIKRYIFEISMYITVNTRVEYDKLKDLLRDSMRFTAAKGILTYDKVIDVWQRNGPVAATLFTWIRNQESSVQKDGFTYTKEGFICTSAKKQSVTLHLPSCGKNMVIKTSYSIYVGFTTEQTRKILSIQVTFGDVDVTTKLGFGRRYSPEDCMSLTRVKMNEKLSRAMESMKVVIERLQKELGETVPLISNRFFIWLCYFFPDKLNLLEENRLNFKDAARNIKPTDVSVQTAKDQFDRVQQFENNLVSGWESDEDPKLKYSKMIVETINILVQKSETKILERLQRDASTFYEIVTYCDLRKLPQKYLLDLVLRTTLEESIYTPAGIAKMHTKRVFFKCFGGRVIKVCGSVRTLEEISIWNKLKLEFTLPDGEVLKLEPPLQIETLSPVTELLKEGVNQTIQGEKHIPEFGNFLTAVYFLHALGFSEASSIAFNSFDALIPLSRYPESEEEEEEYFHSHSPFRPWRDDDY